MIGASRMGSTDDKVLGTIFGNVDEISLGIDIKKYGHFILIT